MKKTVLKSQLRGLALVVALGAGLLFSDGSVLPLVSAQNLPTLGDTGREDLSPVMERRMGEEIMRSLRQDPDYLDD